MADKVRLRNEGGRTEIVYIDGDAVTVVPRGTIVVEEGHQVTKLRQFKRVTGAPPKSQETVALEARIAQLEALLAEQSDEAPEEPVEDDTEEDAEDEDEVAYPRFVNGRFQLSDGSFLKGGTSRADAEAQEAELQKE